MYELRYAYSTDTTIGEAEVRSRHEHIDDAAEAFVNCSAPYRRVIWVGESGHADAGIPDHLDELEQRRLAEVCARHGYEIEEVAG